MMAVDYPTPNLAHFSSDDFNFIYEPAEDTFLFLDALEQEVDFLEKLRLTFFYALVITIRSWFLEAHN